MKKSSGTMSNFTIRFSDEEAQWLKREAAKEFRTVANLVRWIIAEYRRSKTECPDSSGDD